MKSRILDTIGVWLVAAAALAMLNLGIPALVGMIFGGAQ